jgi:hypothetical protein
LNADRNAVFTSIAATLNSVIDAGSEQETNGNAELVAGYKRATDFLGANLGHVENDDGRLETDTNTSDSTASNKKVPTACSHLQNHT